MRCPVVKEHAMWWFILSSVTFVEFLRPAADTHIPAFPSIESKPSTWPSSHLQPHVYSSSCLGLDCTRVYRLALTLKAQLSGWYFKCQSSCQIHKILVFPLVPRLSHHLTVWSQPQILSIGLEWKSLSSALPLQQINWVSWIFLSKLYSLIRERNMTFPLSLVGRRNL